MREWWYEYLTIVVRVVVRVPYLLLLHVCVLGVGRRYAVSDGMSAGRLPEQHARRPRLLPHRQQHRLVVVLSLHVVVLAVLRQGVELASRHAEEAGQQPTAVGSGSRR